MCVTYNLLHQHKATAKQGGFMSNLEYMVMAQTRYDNITPSDDGDEDRHSKYCHCRDCEMASAEEYYDAKNYEADYD